jgi:hypothetical protein
MHVTGVRTVKSYAKMHPETLLGSEGAVAGNSHHPVHPEFVYHCESILNSLHSI